jgi:hypothetical protein
MISMPCPLFLYLLYVFADHCGEAFKNYNAFLIAASRFCFPPSPV